MLTMFKKGFKSRSRGFELLNLAVWPENLWYLSVFDTFVRVHLLSRPVRF